MHRFYCWNSGAIRRQSRWLRVVQRSWICLFLTSACSNITPRALSESKEEPAPRSLSPLQQRLTPEQLYEALAQPVINRATHQFGPAGFLPLPAPSSAFEESFRAALANPATATVVVSGQDLQATDGYLALFASRLAEKSRQNAVWPLFVETPNDLVDFSDGMPHLRVRLAQEALQKQFGIGVPEAEVIRALTDGEILIFINDFDRIAEIIGPEAALRTFEQLALGPGKLVMRSRPIWFESQVQQSQELDTRERGDEELVVSTFGSTVHFVTASSMRLVDLSQVQVGDFDGRSAVTRSSGKQELLAWATEPELTGLTFRTLSDRYLLEPLMERPNVFFLVHGWMGLQLEHLIGEGQVAETRAAWHYLEALALHQYRRDEPRSNHPLTASSHRVSDSTLEKLCQADGLLICQRGNIAFHQQYFQDFFVASWFHSLFSQAPETFLQQTWQQLSSRRPGAGVMAFLAGSFDAVPECDKRIAEQIELLANQPPSSSSDPGHIHLLEALIRLRELRQSVVRADGGLLPRDASDFSVFSSQSAASRDFWARFYRQEDETLQNKADSELDRFLRSKTGKSYRRDKQHELVVIDREKRRWVFVPAGTSILGSYASASEERLHFVGHQPPYLLSVTPITSEEFLPFVHAHFYAPHLPLLQASWSAFLANWEDSGTQTPVMYPDGMADHPVVHVSYEDAVGFSQYVSKQSGWSTVLPTSDDWEVAARGIWGRRYPWGDRFDAARANSYDVSRWQTTPVTMFSAVGQSPYGNADMAGNVWQWTAPRTVLGMNEGLPSSMDGTDLRMLKGGSWRSPGGDIRSARQIRAPAKGRYDVVGFRLKREIR